LTLFFTFDPKIDFMLKKIYRFLSPKFQMLAMEYKVNFKPRYGHGLPPHKQLNDIINENRAEYAQILRGVLSLADTFQKIKKTGNETNTMRPTWNNGFLPGLDIMVLYTLIGMKNPAQYIEIGSGNSTKVVAKAVDDFRLPTRITSIDPFPRAEIDEIAHKIIREPFENIDFSFIFDLKLNDILFIDNSHRVLPNSDAMVFFMEVLPKLPVGVIVHIHDIYLPHDYPQFMCDRFYSEQYLLAAFIMANPKRYCPIMPNYFVSEDKELSSILDTVWVHPNLQGVEKHGGSFWLQIRATN
jgi:Methyltransferase domain